VPGEVGPGHAVLTVATLNTMGLPALRSGLQRRYKAIGAAFERTAADVVLCQEVFTYYHLALLTRHLPSYRAHHKRSVAGPAGGLVTFSKEPALATRYYRFPPCTGAELGAAGRLRAQMKGAIVTVFGAPEPVAMVNTHLLANSAGDWSEGSTAYRAQGAQLASLGQIVRAQDCPVVAAGDFNMPATTPRFKAFLAAAGLADAFGGACPPTFRAGFLRPGAEPHCIDFILRSDAVQVNDHGLLFAADNSGPVSDHLGLFATVTIGRSC
jgi:endonuclease/exonuclease/phosphatase family metal-dependent hydrolase